MEESSEDFSGIINTSIHKTDLAAQYLFVHCCPRTVESIATSVDFIGLFAQNSTPSKPGFTAESRRSLREISSAPIGRRRLEQNLRPFGNKIEPFY